MGAQLNYRDILFNNRVFDVLVNLTPGVKFHLGHRWEIGGELLVPVINQYGERYKKVRVNLACVSKQFGLFGRWRMKVGGGWFGYERYGIDVKNMIIINRWLAMTAQIGVTGYISMASDWEASKMGRISALVGPEVYLERWNTHISLRGGRFVYKDYGAVGEIMRHFKHVSFSVYGSCSSKWKENAGFKVVIMLPPYTRKRHKVNIRPMSNFRFTYSTQTESYANYMYITDLEQNEREGWFEHDLLPWGPDSAFTDFKYVEVKHKDAVK